MVDQPKPPSHSLSRLFLQLAGFELEVVKTSAGHARKLAASVDFSTSPDGIICVRGDGILNEVLNGLLSRDNQKKAILIPIGIIPAGSDNSLVWTVLGVRNPVSTAIAIVKDDGGPRLTSDIEIKVFSHPCRLQGKPKKWYLLPHERQAIQAYFLLNVPECDTFISIFEETLKREHPLISDIEVASHLQRNFTSWFAQYVTEQDNIPKIYKDISHGPLVEVTSYNKCFINGHRFYTEKYGAKKASYNSGVCVDGGGLEYYGHIQEILEIEFPGLPIKRCTIFNCEWYDPTSGVGTKKHGRYNLVEVNKKKKLHTYEPFILAIQATQVCYLPFPSMKKDKANWLAVCRVRPRGWIDMSGEIVESQEEVDTYQNAVVEPCTIKTPTEGEQLYLASTDGGSGIPIDNSDGSDTDDEEIFFETFSTSELNQLSPTSSDYDVSAE
ncbi:uncharacterized protein LOC127266224 isoform X2 [Andrographis paniculata]|uniref:uncharacterized protein LOC127266224 isoform X2 n=1 Tax=Andrographis paniculata TaxID=175694 RepID=UPI0021E7B397|nr:uncharacterized protein LOC127266224 isoform X2 [Andrographis paniculata]